MPDLIVTLLLVIFALAARKAEKVAVESIDTAQQTPQDYTVGQLAIRLIDRLFCPNNAPHYSIKKQQQLRAATTANLKLDQRQ